MIESLPYSPEVITTLLIGYTPLENNKFKLKKNTLWKGRSGSILRCGLEPTVNSFPDRKSNWGLII